MKNNKMDRPIKARGIELRESSVESSLSVNVSNESGLPVVAFPML
jgi:hypothetical protein